MRRISSSNSSSRIVLTAIVAAALATAGVSLSSQTRYASGQNVVPVFEGWERNGDGSFTMVFGYMNRNYEQEIDLPIGPNNTLEPGAADQGQPTHFYPRRQQFVFKVKVPKDWGKKDLVWTLKMDGKTEKAYASLLPFWELGDFVYQENRGSTAGITDQPEPNDAPSIKIVGPSQVSITAGASLPLVAEVTDDGHPAPRGRAAANAASSAGGAAARGANAGAAAGAAGGAAGRGAVTNGAPTGASDSGTAAAAAAVRRDSDGAVVTPTGTPGPGGSGPRRENPLTQAIVRNDPGVGLGVTWIVFRGTTKGVTFTGQRTAVANGKTQSSVQFTEPGTYTLRAYADDGVLITPADLTVTVTRSK
jgi:hypothetical protein